MGALQHVEALAVLGPILLMIGVGLAITLSSGVVRLSSGHDVRRMAANLSQTALLLVACLVGLVILQELVGFRVGLFH